MTLEKYYKVSDLAEDLTISYKHLIADTKGYVSTFIGNFRNFESVQFTVYASVTDESYIEYARFISRGIQEKRLKIKAVSKSLLLTFASFKA